MHLQISHSIEDKRTKLRETMSAAAEETIGFVQKKNEDWFNENEESISSLIEGKHRMHLIPRTMPLRSTNETPASNCGMPARN